MTNTSDIWPYKVSAVAQNIMYYCVTWIVPVWPHPVNMFLSNSTIWNSTYLIIVALFIMTWKWARVVKTQHDCIRRLYAGLKNWHAYGLRGNLNMNTNEKLNLRAERRLHWKIAIWIGVFRFLREQLNLFYTSWFSLESAVSSVP